MKNNLLIYVNYYMRKLNVQIEWYSWTSLDIFFLYGRVSIGKKIFSSLESIFNNFFFLKKWLLRTGSEFELVLDPICY